MLKKQTYNRGPRMNQQIRAEYIELIDETGAHHQSIRTSEALDRAQDIGLSLVEIKYDPQRPVCKIMDYGKFQYNKSKQDSVNRKKQRADVEKEIQMTASTARNDVDRLISKAREMLTAGNKIKVVLTFKGRTILHKDEGIKNLHYFLDQLSDVSKVFAPPSLEGKRSTCKIVPLRKETSSSDNKPAAETTVESGAV